MTSNGIPFPSAAAIAAPGQRLGAFAAATPRPAASPLARLVDTVGRLEALADRLRGTMPAARDEAAVLARVDWLRRDLASALAQVAARLLHARAFATAHRIAETAGALERGTIAADDTSADRPHAATERLLCLTRACLADAEAALSREPPDPPADAASPLRCAARHAATVRLVAAVAPAHARILDLFAGRSGFDPERWDVFERGARPRVRMPVRGQDPPSGPADPPGRGAGEGAA